MKSNSGKFILIGLIVALIGAFFYFDLGQYLSLEYVKSQQDAFQGYYSDNPALVIGIFLLIYIATTALSLPGATILTLTAGFLFGVVTGTIIVSFASTIGATLAFLVARFVLRDSIQEKFGDKLKVVNDGIQKEGAFYLFTLRLIPAFPFFVINVVMGLTPLKTMTFFFVSQIGMLPGTIVYVNAGTQLATIESLGGILNPQLLGSFILLGFFPLIAKKIIEFVKKKKANS